MSSLRRSGGDRTGQPPRPTATRRRRAATTGLVAVATALVLPASPATASCAGPVTPASLREQDGDVLLATAAEVDGHRVLLDVEEVWSGQDRAPEVRITTGETSRGRGSSADVDLQEGRRYLVGLRGDRTGVCGVLAVGGAGGVVAVATAEQVDAARPAGVRAPVEGGDDGDDPGPPVAAVAAGLGGWAALTAVVLLGGRSVRRRQQRRARGRGPGAARTDSSGRRLR